MSYEHMTTVFSLGPPRQSEDNKTRRERPTEPITSHHSRPYTSSPSRPSNNAWSALSEEQMQAKREQRWVRDWMDKQNAPEAGPALLRHTSTAGLIPAEVFTNSFGTWIKSAASDSSSQANNRVGANSSRGPGRTLDFVLSRSLEMNPPLTRRDGTPWRIVSSKCTVSLPDDLLRLMLYYARTVLQTQRVADDNAVRQVFADCLTALALTDYKSQKISKSIASFEEDLTEQSLIHDPEMDKPWMMSINGTEQLIIRTLSANWTPLDCRVYKLSESEAEYMYPPLSDNELGDRTLLEYMGMMH